MKRITGRIVVAVLVLSGMLVAAQPAMANCQYCKYIWFYGYTCADAIGVAGRTYCHVGFTCGTAGEACTIPGGGSNCQQVGDDLICEDFQN